MVHGPCRREVMISRILIVLCLSLSGCSGSPIAPTGTAGFPDIAGTYSGTLTLTITGAPGHPPMRGTSTLVVTVTQSGSEVTLSGTQTWPGESPQLIWDGVRGTIDAIGIFTGPEAKDSTDVDCGRVRYRSRRIQFSVGILSYSLVADTEQIGADSTSTAPPSHACQETSPKRARLNRTVPVSLGRFFNCRCRFSRTPRLRRYHVACSSARPSASEGHPRCSITADAIAMADAIKRGA